MIALGGGAFIDELEIVSNNGVSGGVDCPFSTVEGVWQAMSIARWRAIRKTAGAGSPGAASIGSVRTIEDRT